MKRDCGPGDLIPIKYEVVSCAGKTDTEVVTKHNTLQEALAEHENRKTKLAGVVCSNIRLYAKDKKGYANCVKRWMIDARGEVGEVDRTNEL